MKNTDIAIIGMSCFLPGAKNINEFWNNLINGIDSISEIPAGRFDPDLLHNQSGRIPHKGGFIPDITFDSNLFGLDSSITEKIEPTNLLTLKLVHQALEDAGISKENIPSKNTSLIIGKENYVETKDLHSINAIHSGKQIAEVIKNILPSLSEEDIQKVKKTFQKSQNTTSSPTEKGPSGSAAAFIANTLQINGSAYTIDASCASSLVALEHSSRELLNGKVEIAISGGIHFSHNAAFWNIFSQQGILSKKQQMSPFSEEADGLLIGEGAGFVVLKKLENALSDNDKIYAVIKGIGINNYNTEKKQGQKKVILEAWEKAGIFPDNLGYIEVNGAASKEEDLTELQTLTEVFPDSSKIILGSVKSNIGHTMSASGIAGLIKTALALYHRQIPPTLHCTTPLKQLENTHFSLTQEITNWKDDSVAGINAFGFDGMNAHAVLQAFHKSTKTQKPSFNEEVLALTAPSKEALLQALDTQKNFPINPENTYRLVLFNPTPDRIKKTKRLISKEKYWKGRQDIWFSNEPLLADNKNKIAFLFPGFDPASNPEIVSIANYFGYSLPEEKAKENPLLSHAFKQFHGGELIDASLKKLGVIPDMNAGHSLGEWFAAKAAGLVSNTTVNNLLQSMDPEKYQTSDVYFIAVGCGIERLNCLIQKIPDLYLSNDNCPNQILLCGTETARDSLIEILKKEQIFYQVLTFQSGFHSPFIKEKLYLLDEALEHIELQKNEIPIWSATTLDLYPSSFKEFKELTIQHLLETVRFRELIEKLYQKEQVRMFVQIGSGSLIGFVDDTLKGKEYAAISSCVTTKSTLEQLRRILALLFIEGREIDLTFLGVKEKPQIFNEEIKLSLNTHFVEDYSIIRELAEKYKPAAATSPNSLLINSDHPVIQAMNENIKELISMQTELAGFMNQNYTLRKSADTITKNIPENQPEQPIIKESFTPKKEKQTSFEEPLRISLETHPYIIDHSLFRQPKYWTDLSDIGPVIPMTMTFELLVEAAHKQDLTKKVLQLGPVSVFQWMRVDYPFEQIITGNWKSDTIISLGIKNYASAEVTLGNSYPEPPAEYTQDTNLGENIAELPTPEKIYREHMFHGPAYQGVIEVKEVTRKGLRATIKKAGGKGSLLDNIGQLFGLYLQLTLEESCISFPVKVDEINFYQDIHDQDGVFEFLCLITSLTNEFAVADIILKREGKIWCIIKNWKNQRLGGFDKKLWNLTLFPQDHLLAQEIAPQIYYFNNAYSKAVNWEFITKIYLNREEKQHYESLQLNKRKDYLISRIALKDAARAYIQKHYGKKYFPIEFSIKYDSYNKPSVYGVKETAGLEISLAHKGTDAVSIISGKPVGIDIETIQDRGEGFLDLAFTEKELNLLKEKELSEWTTRFWTAKEAYGKMKGTGLKGNPKQFEVETIEGENLIIQSTTIKTNKLNDNFIIGWTQ